MVLLGYPSEIVVFGASGAKVDLGDRVQAFLLTGLGPLKNLFLHP